MNYYTARPQDTWFLVLEKSSVGQNCTSLDLNLCTEVDYFSRNSVRLQCILRLHLYSIVYSVIQGHSILIIKHDCQMAVR